MFNPKVSIIIPVYNGSNYLKEAIDSALAQTYKNTEIIVINDGSNDNGATERIALSFGDKINYLYKKNGGVSSALNLGIEKMNGEYFSWLSHDDLYYPNKIEEQIKFLNKINNKKTIISTNYELINEKGVLLKEIKLTYKPEELLFKLFINSFLNGCTLLINKNIFNDIGNFDHDLKTTQDYHLWFKIMKKYNFINLDKTLVKSRQHREQDTIKKEKLVIKERKSLENFILKNYSISEIKESAGSNMPNYIFKIKLYFLLRLPYIFLFLKKIGIYNILIKSYKIILKK